MTTVDLFFKLCETDKRCKELVEKITRDAISAELVERQAETLDDEDVNAVKTYVARTISQQLLGCSGLIEQQKELQRAFSDALLENFADNLHAPDVADVLVDDLLPGIESLYVKR